MTRLVGAVRGLRVDRQGVGLVVGPVLAVVVYLAMPDHLPVDAAVDFEVRSAALVAAVLVLMGLWWMTEALPLPVTALLPLVLFPVLGVADVGAVSAPYANKVIFLFLGGFVLALAMQRWKLHLRIALQVVMLVGSKPTRLVLGFMIATAVLSMWVSNTATAVMMLPIGVSVLRLVKTATGGEGDRNFSTALMLGIAYAATIGSFGTIIASPPNALMVGYLEETHGISVGFGQWMLVGVPLSAVFLVLAWFVLTHVVFRPRLTTIPGEGRLIAHELEALGPMTAPLWRVAGVFVGAAAAWVLVPVLWPGTPVTDEVVAVIVTVVVFLVPSGREPGERLLRWQDTTELPWGILLLFGGGLALASQIADSGLSVWIGERVHAVAGLPPVLLVAVVCVLTVVLTEFMSNTATAATFIPIMGGVAVGLGLSPMMLVMPVALTAACTFMMPAATPPNAIAFSSGHVTIPDMIRGGVLLSLSGIVLITGTMYTLGAWVFGLAF